MKSFNRLICVLSIFVFIGSGCAPIAPQAANPVPAKNSANGYRSQNPPSPTPAPVPPPAPVPIKKAISISGFSFQPGDLTVSAGTTVVWTNLDPINHTITANDGSFDSGPVAPNGSYSHTFSQAGSFSYHCSIHPSMQGTIVVQ